ncbi:MAG TPA: sugar ABC transporter ATP-binding protein [Vicinamibacteria bacterium]|jgi:rhamnose transport system ATP-binding protein|nr:sugar ABC transporter ATP-binding protein [Vicinamibacteria bacterium]
MGGLEFREVAKSFGAVRALRGVSFAVERAEAHALVGENGAGKSTLMKVLAGILRPDSGELLWEGERLDLATPRHALDHGIGMVYQEQVLFPNLSVSENIFAGRELTDGRGRLRNAEMRARTGELIEELHLTVRPDEEAGSLSTAQRQLLQIARALAFDCRILILDEPTTCLTDAETADLFRILERLRTRGVTLLYVSHKLPEIFRLCDRITVLRDGGHVGSFARSAVTAPDIVRAMVGRDLESASGLREVDHAAPPVLEVDGLTRRPWFEGVSLVVRRGEIVGLFGLVGSGRSELLETLFGVRPSAAGGVRFQGAPLHVRSPVAAVRAGIALAPEDRQRQGLFFNLSARDNMVMARELASGRWRIDAQGEAEASSRMQEDLEIKAPSLEATPDRLSGGNQQKLMLARWLLTRPRLLMLDEPTKGVDVGAKYEIHETVRAQAAAGVACLLVSSDLPEVLALAHRIVVMREGRIQGELKAAEATEEGVMRLATAVRH